MLQRILVAVVGIPALLFILCWLPHWATAALLAALCVVAAHELLSAACAKPIASRWFGIAAILGVLVTFSPYWATHSDTAMVLMPWLFAAFLVLLFVALVVEHGKKDGLRFFDVCVILVAGVAIPLALGCLLRLRLLDSGAGMVLIPLVAAFSSDTMALFTGMALGKHKLAPRVSPNKTREGALGGIAGGMVGMVLFRIIFFLVTELQLHILWCILLGLVGAVMGQLGDLVFSCIKREYGIKDYGRLLPGHGGVLDRFDSVIFAAPVIWMLLRYIPLY